MARAPAPVSKFRGLPSSDSKDFLPAVKELLEILMGQRGEGYDRAVTIRDLYSPAMVGFLNTTETPIGTGAELPEMFGTDIPPAPTTMILVKSSEAGRISAFENRLTWTNAVSDIVSHTEIWIAISNNRSAANCVGIVTYPGNEYSHSALDPTVDYFYWIRHVSFAENYSTWEPSGSTDGYVVPGDESIKDSIDKVIDTLKGESPTLYNAGTTYFEGDRVTYVGDDGGTRAFKCIDDNGGAGIIAVLPTDTDHWERSGILVTGEIDGIGTVGVDGNMVVDGTITAQKLIVDELSAVTADLGIVTAGIAKSADDRLVIDFGEKTIKVYDSLDQLRVEIGYIA